MESLQGNLLVSSPGLLDPNFRRTVVLMTHHDEGGAMGVVLSRPSETRVADAVPTMAELVGPDDVVHVGGPVQPEAVVVLAEVEAEHESFEPVVGTVGFLPAGVDLDELRIARVRVFAGYSGWGPGQLEGELAESSWIVVPAEPGDVFAGDPDELWRTVVQRKGGRYKVMESMPFDPGLN
jgi:putative transcriptional regulator